MKKLLGEIIYAYYSFALKTRRPFEYIHILSHMRAGSSLFTHLLVLNPDICGYGETHVPYDNRQALTRVAGKVMYMLRRFPLPGAERFILDKSLHNHLLKKENVQLLADGKSHVIFLVREPAGALSSLTGYLGLSKKEAIDYYTSRLQMLESYAVDLSKKKRCSAFTYDQLIDNTRECFSLLEKQLNLQTPLSENYQLLRTTGKKGIGDASSNIFQGRIIRNRKKATLPDLSTGELNFVWNAYNRCLATLQETCSMPSATERPVHPA